MRIISYKDACEGKIPSRTDFRYVRNQVSTALQKSDCILCALEFGSVVSVEVEYTSDYDVLVICEDRCFCNGKVAEVLGPLSELAYYRHVPLAWIVTPLSVAKDATKHTWEESFLKSVLGTNEKKGIIKGDPHSLIDMREEGDMRVYVREYIRRKMSKFRNAIPELYANESFLSEERKRTLLGDVFSFPIHVARKILQCHGWKFPQGDGKNAVYEQYKMRFEGHSVLNLFCTLMELRGMYTLAVENMDWFGESPLTQKVYVEMTQLTPKILLLAHDFGEANLDILSQITE
ncbi:MAG: hypothetical protein HGB03_03955 [Candidatus Yonathbacteria bacterium]|nr:hypothetical protein [Candidatus Yonathbacteria bacterium]NTW47614.1 hypothetical protein [Candidatus Yonathbacteria bacterium]